MKIELFSAGTYNGVTFTEEDLQKIAQNFNEFYPKVQPVLKLTHSEEQAFLRIMAKKYGFDLKQVKDIKGERLIGVGTVKNVVYDENDKKLYAEIDQIPQEFTEFAKQIPTRRISPEFYTTNKGYVLRAVSLVDIPANKNLKTVTYDENYKMSENIIYFNELKEEVKMNDLEKKLYEKEREIDQ